MSWVIWIGLFVVAVVLFKRFLPSPQDFGAATNALLAEHYLSSRPSKNANFEAQLAQMLTEVLRAGGFPNAADELVERQFNRGDRFVQLNAIALALDHAGVRPDISGEIWHTVNNPFRLTADQSNLHAVSDRIQAQHGLRLSIRDSSVHLEGNRLVDLGNSLFGGDRPSKNELIRALAKQRVRQDPTASAMGFNEHMVDSLEMLQLAGLPESTIVTIAETYAILKKRGTPDHEIFTRIEAHRSSIGSGEIPSRLDLESYTQYRIAVEHHHGAPISEEYLAEAVRISRQHFGC